MFRTRGLPMPIREYKAASAEESCAHCRDGFEFLHKTVDLVLEHCPQCGSPVTKMISAPNVGSSKSGFDNRAKNLGFHKLEKRDKGTYEKKY